MELSTLIPVESTFYLRSVNRDFTMNPITLADEIWLQSTFGENLAHIFEQGKMPEICRIVFRLLTQDDKKYLQRQTVTIVKESGEVEEIELGGVDLLFSMISGMGEKTKIVEALSANFGFSHPDVEEKDKKKTKKK